VLPDFEKLKSRGTIPPTMSQTYNPSKVKRARKHGFRSRTKSAGGKKILVRRMRKGRASLTVSSEK
jgi:large subunit ribosomal protein L34